MLSLLLLVAMAQPAAPDGLHWSDVRAGPPPFELPSGRHPSPASIEVPSVWVTVDASGTLSRPLSRGPAVLVVDPRLPAEAMVLLAADLHEAGTEPVLVRQVPQPRPQKPLLELQPWVLDPDAFAVPMGEGQRWSHVQKVPPQWVRLDDGTGPRFDDWTRCSVRAQPLTPADWPERGDALPTVKRAAALAEERPKASIEVDANGAFSAPPPAGPLVLWVDDELPDDRLPEVMAALHEAGSEPLLPAHTELRPEGTYGHPEQPLPTPAPHLGRNDDPIAAWSEALRLCEAGRALLAGSCEGRDEQWAAVLSDPECEVDAVPDGALVADVEGPYLALVPWRIDPSALVTPVSGLTRWERWRAAPPTAVRPVELPEDVLGARYVHYSELEVKRRVTPKHPDEGAKPVRCNVSIGVNAKGKPLVAVPDCPEPYASASVKALMQWRWKAPGEVVATRIGVNFVSR